MPRVIETNDARWLERLRGGHYVWLSKERQYGQVAHAYIPPEPGYRCGHIFLRRLTPEGESYRVGHIEDWFIFPDGAGLDRSQLLQPTEGNLPDDPPPISEPVVRELKRHLGALQQYVEQLEARVTALESAVVSASGLGRNSWLDENGD